MMTKKEQYDATIAAVRELQMHDGVVKDEEYTALDSVMYKLMDMKESHA